MKMSLARILVTYDDALKNAHKARNWFREDGPLQIELSMGRNVLDDLTRTLNLDRDALNHVVQQFLTDRIDMKIKEIEATIAELETQ